MHPEKPRNARNCIFVISHPRSGTHLLIDFIRKNFPKYKRKLKPWESASHNYVGLDSLGWQERIDAQLRDRNESHFLLHSHYAGVVTATEQLAMEKLEPERSVFFYPFRQFSTTIKSYAEFRRASGPIEPFLLQIDQFFGRDTTVEQCIRMHAEKWLPRDIHWVDIDRLMSDPEITCKRLAELIEENPADITQRLPRRRRFAGRFAEFVQRLTGRESTEYCVDYEIPWQCPEEKAAIDAHFAGLYSELVKRRIN
jgi:hypothetical protein